MIEIKITWKFKWIIQVPREEFIQKVATTSNLLSTSLDLYNRRWCEMKPLSSLITLIILANYFFFITFIHVYLMQHATRLSSSSSLKLSSVSPVVWSNETSAHKSPAIVEWHHLVKDNVLERTLEKNTPEKTHKRKLQSFNLHCDFHR